MLNIRTKNNKNEVQCIIRKRWITLFPEEWVRQHFLLLLINQLQISPLRLGVEVSLKYHQLKKRADIVVWDTSASPIWIIECKEENVLLTENVLHQLLIYYSVMPVKYLTITNGKQTITWQHTNLGNWELMNNFPENV